MAAAAVNLGVQEDRNPGTAKGAFLSLAFHLGGAALAAAANLGAAGLLLAEGVAVAHLLAHLLHITRTRVLCSRTWNHLDFGLAGSFSLHASVFKGRKRGMGRMRKQLGGRFSLHRLEKRRGAHASHGGDKREQKG